MNTPPTAPYQTDEISLRDLYLIVKKAFLPAVIIAVLVGAVTFVYLTMQPKTYTAEATTLVTPLIAEPSFSLGEETLRVASGTAVSYEAYEAIAFSRRVLNEVIAAVPEYEKGATQLRKQLTLKKLVGPANVTQTAPLSVIHTANNTSPEVAAKLADEWANITIRTVSESMLDDMRPIVTATTKALADAEVAVELAESALRKFEETSSLALLEQEYRALSDEFINANQTLRSTRAERNALSSQLQSLEVSLAEERVLSLLDSTNETAFLARAAGIINADQENESPMFTAGLVVLGENLLAANASSEVRRAVADLRERTTPEAIASMRISIAQQNGATNAAAGGMVRSVVDELRVATFETRGQLNATESTIESASEQIEWLEERMTDLRLQLSEMRAVSEDLQRDATLARGAYTSLARLEPLVGFFSELTPGNARILNTAFVPDEANPTRRLTTTAIAVIVTGLLVIMFAFLREAVREPEPR